MSNSLENYRNETEFIAGLESPVIKLLAPKAGEKILDLGCGNGALARELMDLGCSVVGADSSRKMVKRLSPGAWTRVC